MQTVTLQMLALHRKRQLNIFGISLVKNILTVYVNTKHITEENTIRSTNSS